MSVATQIQNYNAGLLAAYGAVQTKGGTVPASKNMVNLPTAINSIPSGGGGSNIVAKASVTKITNNTAYQNTTAEVTIPSTGTWKLSWYCYTSSSTSSSTKAKLFKNGTTEVGSSHQAKAYSSGTPEICEETLSLNAGDKIMVKGCTKSGTSYYIYIVNLIAEKQ
mgnify:CR=1 FL=1